jgi:hypothetical protein
VVVEVELLVGVVVGDCNVVLVVAVDPEAADAAAVVDVVEEVEEVAEVVV